MRSHFSWVVPGSRAPEQSGNRGFAHLRNGQHGYLAFLEAVPWLAAIVPPLSDGCPALLCLPRPELLPACGHSQRVRGAGLVPGRLPVSES